MSFWQFIHDADVWHWGGLVVSVVVLVSAISDLYRFVCRLIEQKRRERAERQRALDELEAELRALLLHDHCARWTVIYAWVNNYTREKNQ